MEVEEIWSGFDRVQDSDLHAQSQQTWAMGLQRSPRQRQDLREIRLAEAVGDCNIFCLVHKPLVAQSACDSALKLADFTGDDRFVNQDTLNAGVFMAGVGQCLDDKIGNHDGLQTTRGTLLRHPFHKARFVKAADLLPNANRLTFCALEEGLKR